jgi:hypothetical protein
VWSPAGAEEVQAKVAKLLESLMQVQAPAPNSTSVR